MKPLLLLAVGATIPALSATAAANAAAQQRSVSTGGRITLPSPSGPFAWEGKPGFRGGHHRGFPIFVVERERTIVREVIREVPLRQAQDERLDKEPPPPPRKPYVIGASYASLPTGCMKLIEDGISYYGCSGEWYRQVGKLYRAVRAP